MQIVEIIRKEGKAQVKSLVRSLGITPAAVHRSLNKLLDQKILIKRGTPPTVFYFLNEIKEKSTSIVASDQMTQTLDQNFMYITPIGKIETGVQAFLTWMKNTKNQQNPERCLGDYLSILKEAQSHREQKTLLIDASERFKNIFPEPSLDKIYYHDFYSLIKFGKTKLGQLLLHGKQAQDKKIIYSIAELIKPNLERLIKLEKIEAIAWVPHSIPRKLPFLNELERTLDLELPKIELIKLYSGDVPIAQKSLSKLEERILNAQETIVVVSNSIKFKNILIIDDAVGSGATLNEVGKKLRAVGAKKIIGYAIVGSYKGFEVIKEV